MILLLLHHIVIIYVIVGHVLLTDLLLEKLKESSGRIINVTAPAYQLGTRRIVSS